MASFKNQKQHNSLCKHCEQELPAGLAIEFCCAGCEQVYRILNESGLSEYYSFRALEEKHDFQPAQLASHNFTFFNDPEFIDQHVRFSADGIARANLFLLGVQCAACVWLVEKLPEYCPGVIKAELDFSTAVLSLAYDPKLVTLQEIASSLGNIGYLPEPYHPGAEEQYRRKTTRLLLLQLGVAGFCAGNTMLLAVALYQGFFTGIADHYRNFLHIVSFTLTLPAVFFSAQAFFKAAYASLKIKRLHIDFPISLGIIVGFAYSTFAMLSGQEVYFDSICMLIFLLLTGRYVQKVAVEKAVSKSNIENHLLPHFARVKQGNEFVERFIKSVKINDHVKVLADEVIPVDGQVLEGNSAVSNAFLTGEADPLSICSGARVFAGARNLSGEIILKAEQDFYSSRVYKILALVKNLANQKSASTSLVNRLSSWFVAVVLSLTGFCFAFWIYYGTVAQAVIYSISLLIVTCPCALGLAAPLVIARAVAQSAKQGILIKTADFFDLILSVENIYFDKTGTLTNGNFQIKEQAFYRDLKNTEILQRVAMLEKTTQHPMRSAFVDIEEASALHLVRQEQFPGLGVEGLFADNVTLLLGSERFMRQQGVKISEEARKDLNAFQADRLSSIMVAQDGHLIACLGLGDTLRSGIREFIEFLQKRSRKIIILSGDNQQVVSKTAAALGIDQAFAELSPEEKSKLLQADQKLNCMFGDGANDAPALKSANVSIGVGGGSEVGLLVSDCFLQQPKAACFKALFSNADLVSRVIRRNIIFSIAYNVIGAGLAFSGFLNPLIAAILMPVSSITVIVSALQFRFKERSIV